MKEVCEETDAKNMKDEAKEKPSDKAPNNTENDSVKDDDDKDVETADDALLELLNENETKESLAKTTEPINSEPDLKQTSGKPESTTGKPESIKDIISNIENSPKKSHESKLSDIEGISRKFLIWAQYKIKVDPLNDQMNLLASFVDHNNFNDIFSGIFVNMKNEVWFLRISG